jgi:hydrogenase expression/formation protein HypE
MKDPTRGGLANSLNEWSEKSGVGLLIEEDKIPYNQSVTNACDMLGLDPLEIGNEGKVLIAVVPSMADEVLAKLHTLPEGKNAAIIGEATTEVDSVVMHTLVGGRRIVEPPLGDPIPRIC